MKKLFKMNNKLITHWFVCAAMILLLLSVNMICHVWGAEIRVKVDESQRLLLRTLLYVIAIALFPLTNLVRHILLRLNQTMPGSKTAEQRYLTTVLVTQAMIEPVSVFGVLMFILGDDFNTLYIFSLMGLLGIFLHQPKLDELQDIAHALSSQKD